MAAMSENTGSVQDRPLLIQKIENEQVLTVLRQNWQFGYIWLKTEKIIKDFPSQENVFSSAHRTCATSKLGAVARWYSNILMEESYVVSHCS